LADTSRTTSRAATSARNLVQRFAFIGLVLGAFALMLLGKADAVLMERVRAQVTDAVAPVLEVLSQPVVAITNVVENVQEITALREENARLRAERERLLQWQSAARNLETENRSLRELLRYVPGPEASYISARVIADTGGAFAHSLVVNAGARAHVRKGQAVITGEGLVGRVAGVGRRAARVLLITDLNSRIPVVVESSRTRAILAGNNSDRPSLIHLPPGAVVSPGERIVTSGHGGAFPPGLAVGVVASVSDGGIAVMPYVDRDWLEYVRLVDFGLEGILRIEAQPAPQEYERTGLVVAPPMKPRDKAPPAPTPQTGAPDALTFQGAAPGSAQ